MWLLVLFIIVVYLVVLIKPERKNNNETNENKQIKSKDNECGKESNRDAISKAESGRVSNKIPLINTSILKAENILIFDCETTGLIPGYICQLSYLLINRGNVTAKNFYFTVDYVEPAAEKVHNLSVKKLISLSRDKRFEDHLAEIKGDFESVDLLIAHNYNFDIKFMKQSFLRSGYRFVAKSSFCTMEYFTDICKLYHHWYKYKYPKLEELEGFLKLDRNNSKNMAMKYFNQRDITFHDARYDVVTTYYCLLKGIEQGYIKGFNTLLKELRDHQSKKSAVSIEENIYKPNIIIVDFGDVVYIEDSSGEVSNFEIEHNPYNKHLMRDIEKVLIGKKLNETFIFKGYNYKVLNISKT